MSSEPPSRQSWEELLSDRDVVVLTKSTFFRTVDLLFRYAESPERCTWEFFHYRGYEYILGTWCATFNFEGFAMSCGAQHPFIHRLKKGMHYALPDYVLLSHKRDANGEQEDHLVLVVEIKALGKVDPDTQAGRETAENIFQKTWMQRENQARLAFRSHPSQRTVNIVMASGPWFALYIYERSQLMRDGTVDNGQLLRDSKTTKRRRRAEDVAYIDREDVEVGVAGTTTVDSGKRKRETEDTPDTNPVVNHIFQLGPSGERDALNPWFLHMLGQMKDNMEPFRGEFKTQNSWFDWPTDVIPTGDGHAEGFDLPATGGPILDVERVDVGHIIRLDEDPALVSRASMPSTPGSSRETLSMLEVNALLSPTMHRRSRTIPDDDDVPSESTHSHYRFGSETLPPQHQEAQSVYSDSPLGTDEDTTPKGQHGRQPQGTSDIRHQDRELSPSAAYLERRKHGPANPPQFHPTLPDSSPPHLTPQKRLFFPPMADEGSESLTGYFSSGPEAILRPASAPPVPSSPPSYIGQPPSRAYPASRGIQPVLSDHAQKDYVSRSTLPAHPIPLPLPAQPSPPIPPPRVTQSTITYVNPPPFHIGAPRRRITQTGDPTVSKKERETATPEEWRRVPPTNDELLLIVLKASSIGFNDHRQAFLNAGMTESQALSACQQHNESIGVTHMGGGRTSGTPSSFAAPALDIQQRPTIDTTRVRGGLSQMSRSGAGTGPPPASWGTAASRAASRTHPSRPTPTGTAGHNESDSELLNDSYPDDVLNPRGLGPASDAQMNRLTEGIGNLDVTNLSGAGGDLEWNQDNLYGFEPLACTNRRKVFRDLKMHQGRAQAAYGEHAFKVARDSEGQEGQRFREFLVEHGAEAENIDGVLKALAERQRRPTTGGDAHSPPGASNRERVDPSRQQTDSESDSAGPSGTSTSRKGKEKQG